MVFSIVFSSFHLFFALDCDYEHVCERGDSHHSLIPHGASHPQLPHPPPSHLVRPLFMQFVFSQFSLLMIIMVRCRNANVLGRKTQLRLNSLLMDFASPGAPLYPTRPVRDAANQTLDILFPVRFDFAFHFLLFVCLWFVRFSAASCLELSSICSSASCTPRSSSSRGTIG